MSLEKESKMLEQGIVVWLLFAAAVLIVWGAAFAAAVYVLKLMTASPAWLWTALAATVVTTGFLLTAKKFLWK